MGKIHVIGSARLSMKSRSRQLLFSLGWSRSRQPQKFPVSMSLGLDNHRISQSRWVSVSTPQNFPVSMSLGLDNHRISQSRWVSVSTTTEIPSLDESRSRQPQNLIVSMSLGHNIKWISKYRFKRSTHKKLFFFRSFTVSIFFLKKSLEQAGAGVVPSSGLARSSSWVEVYTIFDWLDLKC